MVGSADPGGCVVMTVLVLGNSVGLAQGMASTAGLHSFTGLQDVTLHKKIVRPALLTDGSGKNLSKTRCLAMNKL
jgi:hypothetical protein